MNLCFFGYNGSWMHVINEKLLSYLPKIKSIQNFRQFDAKIHEFDIAIPLLERDVQILHDNAVNPSIIAMPSLSIINTFRCKNAFYNYIVSNNLQNYVANTYQNTNDVTYLPIIVKPFSMNSGSGMFIIDNTTETLCMANDELVKYIEDICLKKNINNLAENKYLIQDYIVSPYEYVAHIVANQGKIVLCITYECNYNSNNYIKGPVSNNDLKNMKKITLDTEHVDKLEELLKPCNFTGVCNIDFKIIYGNLKVFEINPRLGGSLTLYGNTDDLIEILNALIDVYLLLPAK